MSGEAWKPCWHGVSNGQNMILENQCADSRNKVKVQHHHPHLPCAPMTAFPGSICCGKKGDPEWCLFFWWEINQGELSPILRFFHWPLGSLMVRNVHRKGGCWTLKLSPVVLKLCSIPTAAEMANDCWDVRAVPHVLFSQWGVDGRKAKLHLLRY